MEKMVLGNSTDIYSFFEIINQAEVNSILDVGMFLKRIGSVSRQVKDREISLDTELVGIDLFPEIRCPVWNTIYDMVYGWEFFENGNSGQIYDMAVVLDLDGLIDLKQSFLMWKWISEHVSYILTDWVLGENEETIKFHSEQEIIVDEKVYRFLIV